MTASEADRGRRPGRAVRYGLLAVGILGLAAILVLLRLALVTDHLYHSLVKDPERVAPDGSAIVAPADGTVLYVREVRGGTVPEVVKRGVPVPIVDLLKTPEAREFRDGWLIGIYMNTFGVHINRIPNHGRVKERIIFNGPHADMTDAEARIILTEMVPGLVSLRRALGLTEHGIEGDADFILQSARETLVVEDERGVDLYVVRIADYYVGKILTWVTEGEQVERGQRLGMISWGSQTDLFIEATPGLKIVARAGDYVYGGESVVATY